MVRQIISKYIKKVTRENSDEKEEFTLQEQDSSSPDLPLLSSPEPSLTEDTPQSSPQSQKWRDRATIVIVLICNLLITAATIIFGVFFPEEGRKRGASPAVTGAIIASCPLFIILVSPLAGYIINITGPKFLMILGLLLFGCAFILMRFAFMVPLSWLFILVTFILQIIAGVGSGLYFTCTFKLLFHLVPSSIGTIMGVLELCIGIGLGAGLVIGGGLDQAVGFKLTVIIATVPVLMMILPTALLQRKIVNKEKRTIPMKVTLMIFTDVTFILLCTAIFLGSASSFFQMPTVQIYLSDQFNLTHTQIGIIAGLSPVTYTVTAIIVGTITDKLKRYRIFFTIFGLLTCTLSFILQAIPYFTGYQNVWLMVAAFTCGGIGGGFTIVPTYGQLYNAAMKYTKNKDDEKVMTSLTSAILTILIYSGKVFGTFLGGFLKNFLSFNLSAFIFSEILMAEMALFIVLMTLEHLCNTRLKT